MAISVTFTFNWSYFMSKYSFSFRTSIMSSIFALTMSTFFIIICLIGCGAYTKFIKTGTSMPAKMDDCPIEVFNSNLPERKYDELGILEGDGSDTFEDVLPKLIQEACRAGGDAIIIKTIQKYVYDSDKSLIHVTATVIMWQE